jgi:nucleoid-associated protein YgaU
MTIDIDAMNLKRAHRRGGVLKVLLIVLLLAVAAAVVIYLIYTRGADMQKGLRNKGEEIRDKVTGSADDGTAKPPATEPTAAAPAQPPPARQVSKPPAETSKPDYTVKKPPPVQKAWHTVAKGETLYTIAETYYEDGKLWKLIAQANGLKETEPAQLKEGMLIVIPGK